MDGEHAAGEVADVPARLAEQLDHESTQGRRDPVRDIARERHLHPGIGHLPAHRLGGAGQHLLVHREHAQASRAVVRHDLVADQAVGEQALHDELLEAVIARVEVERAQLGMRDVDAVRAGRDEAGCDPQRRQRRVAAHLVRVGDARPRAPAALGDQLLRSVRRHVAGAGHVDQIVGRTWLVGVRGREVVIDDLREPVGARSRAVAARVGAQIIELVAVEPIGIRVGDR